MKTVTFQGRELSVSMLYDKTYMDLLLANEIEYNIDEIVLFQPFLPEDIIAYNGYKINYLDKEGNDVFVYSFITMTYEFTKCISFISKEHLNSIYLLDLEQAMRLGKLVYEGHDDGLKKFAGFNVNESIEVNRLLETYVELDDGCTYEFNHIEEFPEGVSGKKILPNGDAKNVFVIKLTGDEPMLAINEQGAGWKFLDRAEITTIFGK